MRKFGKLEEVGNFGISGFREARNLWKFRNSGNSETFGNFRKLSEFAVVGRRGIGERGSWNVWEDRVWEREKFGESGKLGSLEISGVEELR